MVGMLLFRFGGQAITFIILALLARYLGPEQFGLYSSLTVFIGFCAILLTPSLNDLLIREAVGASAGGGVRSGIGKLQALRGGYGLRLTLAFAGLMLAITIGPLLGWGQISLSLFLLAGLSLFSSLTTPSLRTAYDVPYQLDYRMDTSAGINFAGRLLLLASLYIAIRFDSNLTGVILGQALGEGLGFALLLLLLWYGGYPVLPEFTFTRLRPLLVLAAPLIVAEAFTLAYTRLDVLLLNQLVGAREAGIYSGPIRLIDGLQLIPTVVLGSLIPLLNRLKTTSTDNYFSAVRIGSRLLWAAGIVCALTIAPFSVWLTNLFLGGEFGDSAIILQIGVLGAPLVFAGALLPALLIIEGESKQIVKLYFSLAVISVILNLILIPRYGAVGSIYSKLISYAAIFPVALVWRKSRLLASTLLLQGILPYILAVITSYYTVRMMLPLIPGMPLILIASISAIMLSGWFGRKKLTELRTLFTMERNP